MVPHETDHAREQAGSPAARPVPPRLSGGKHRSCFALCAGASPCAAAPGPSPAARCPKNMKNRPGAAPAAGHSAPQPAGCTNGRPARSSRPRLALVSGASCSHMLCQLRAGRTAQLAADPPLPPMATGSGQRAAVGCKPNLRPGAPERTIRRCAAGSGRGVFGPRRGLGAGGASGSAAGGLFLLCRAVGRAQAAGAGRTR